ncbi:unnamed protein product [Clavelina lepadiformis]|uniref:Uncharacterized protein n=1 Tax=Clavelina lepadiformis TaxID=159417 RepID=A0ABP0FNC7_CLALP
MKNIISGGLYNRINTVLIILVKNSIKPTDQKELNRCNIAALFFGIIGSLGISILGAFQLNSNSKHSNLFAIAEWFQIYFAILFLTTLIEDLRQIHFDVKLDELEDGNHFNQDDNYRTSRQ